MGLEEGRGSVVGPREPGSAALGRTDPCKCEGLGHHPPWVRAGSDPEPVAGSCLGRVLGGPGHSITSLSWDRHAGGCAVRSAVRQRGICLLLRGFGALSAPWVESDPPYSQVPRELLFAHDESAKLLYERPCSEVNLGRAYLLSAMCIEMRNLVPQIIISHGKY